MYKIVSFVKVTGTNAEETSELRNTFLKQIKNVSKTLSSLENELAYGNLAYLTMIGYGASVGGIFTPRIYEDCLNIISKLIIDNSKFEDIPTKELFKYYLKIVLLLLPSPFNTRFDEIVKIWLIKQTDINGVSKKMFVKKCLTAINNVVTEV